MLGRIFRWLLESVLIFSLMVVMFFVFLILSCDDDSEGLP